MRHARARSPTIRYGIGGNGEFADTAGGGDAERVEELRATGEIVIIDVRESEEFALGRIPSSTLIPLEELARRTDEVPTDKPVIMVCRSGNRSAEAVKILQKAGFTNIHNMTGGMRAWTAEGYVPEAER